MTTIRQYILSAVQQRLQEVQERLSTLAAGNDFEQTADLRLEVPETWKSSSDGCLASLRSLAKGELSPGVDDAPEPADEFLQTVKGIAREPRKRFELLTTRYSYPLSFLVTTEGDIREHLIERLMVQDRALIERSSIDSVDVSELLLRLNLLSLFAAVSRDLRYLDALNYCFELLPEHWSLSGEQKDLYVSYLALYARALGASESP